MPTKQEFLDELRARFRRAEERGLSSLEVNAGDLHRSLGGYPGTNHQMPSCCEAMYAEQRAGDELVACPPKGKGASLTMRYRLPRESAGGG
ncbi:MAG TPA: hypothetical protein VGB08_01370 [Allosphingosinicella sp.]|jgi:5-methylcytosine-specific restriction protein A